MAKNLECLVAETPLVENGTNACLPDGTTRRLWFKRAGAVFSLSFPWHEEEEEEEE